MLITLVAGAVRAHCKLCGERLQFTGGNTTARIAAWSASHLRPVVDEVDIETLTGDHVGAWRNPAAA